MVYLWIFLGLTVAVIGLTIANVVVKRVAKKKEVKKQEE